MAPRPEFFNREYGTMQTCDVNVRLSGDIRFQVPKTGVTPAEILVLQAVQAAEDAVADIVVTGETGRNMHEEMSRLIATYGEKRVRAIFPGAHPRLPTTLDEIGITVKPRPASSPAAPTPAEPEIKPALEAKPSKGRRGLRVSSGDPVAAAEKQDVADPVAAAEKAESEDADGPQDDELGGSPPQPYRG